MEIQALARRVQRLEDIEAIKKLKARYCALCDQQYDPEGLAGLFIEDGVWDAGEKFGRHVGRRAIAEFFRGVSRDITFAAHMVLNPIIEVNGDVATGQWYILMPATLQGQQAAWLLAQYHEEYVRVGGEWKYRHLRADIKFFSPYEKGWAVAPFLG
jgi:hypothetical protein